MKSKLIAKRTLDSRVLENTTGTISGEATAPPPYYGNPTVLADLYSLDGKIIERGCSVPVPGAYKTWRHIHTPMWAHSI